jgi:hypothetical protein
MADPDDVRVVAAAPDDGGRRPRWMVAILGVIAALLLGLLIGRLTAPDENDAPPPPTSGGEARVGPSRSVDGVPVGYARTRAGAVAAATNFVAVLSSPAMLDDAQREAAVRRMATEQFAPRLLEQTEAANRRLAAGPLGSGLRQGDATVFQGAQLGYRLVDYSDDRAAVSVWSVAIIANTGAVAPQVGWQTNTFELAWQDGDWRLDGYRGRPGPTPALPRGTELTEGPEFVERVRQLRSYRHVP